MNHCPPRNISDLNRPECFLYPAMAGQFDTVAAIRVISSFLGFFGAFSVIFSVLYKRRLFHAEIHPIFMISLADCLLATLWITGSSIWLTDADSVDDAWCYAVTLTTIIFECVTINLTLVYAIFAYIKTKRTDLNSILGHTTQNGISLKLTGLIYTIAWSLPLLLIMALFGITVGADSFLHSARDCSCWCLPTLINVIPFVRPNNKETQNFMNLQGRLLVGLGVALVLHYLVVFLAMVVLYCKILRKIKKLREEHDHLIFGCKSNENNSSNYGTADATRIVFGQSQAKKRVLLFLTVFIISGLFNMLLAISLLAFVSPHLELIHNFKKQENNAAKFHVYMALLYAQSLTLPLQGFMNAIVYGWTRDDFVQTIAIQNPSEMNSDYQQAELSTDIEQSYAESTYNEFDETLPQSDSD